MDCQPRQSVIRNLVSELGRPELLSVKAWGARFAAHGEEAQSQSGHSVAALEAASSAGQMTAERLFG